MGHRSLKDYRAKNRRLSLLQALDGSIHRLDHVPFRSLLCSFSLRGGFHLGALLGGRARAPRTAGSSDHSRRQQSYCQDTILSHLINLLFHLFRFSKSDSLAAPVFRSIYDPGPFANKLFLNNSYEKHRPFVGSCSFFVELSGPESINFLLPLQNYPYTKIMLQTAQIILLSCAVYNIIVCFQNFINAALPSARHLALIPACLIMGPDNRLDLIQIGRRKVAWNGVLHRRGGISIGNRLGAVAAA